MRWETKDEFARRRVAADRARIAAIEPSSRAARLAAVAIVAFSSEAALRWRANYSRRIGYCTRWDDGPCLRVALALRQFDVGRGEIRAVGPRGFHAVYVCDGVLIDGHGVCTSWGSETYPLDDFDLWVGWRRARAPQALVLALRDACGARDLESVA